MGNLCQKKKRESNESIKSNDKITELSIDISRESERESNFITSPITSSLPPQPQRQPQPEPAGCCSDAFSCGTGAAPAVCWWAECGHCW